MTPKQIRTLLSQIQKLMYGFNYEVTLGLELYEKCFSLEDMNKAVKSTFPASNPGEVTPIGISVDELLQDVINKLDSREEGPGVYLKLSEKQERVLKKKQQEVMGFLLQYIKPDTRLFSYPFLEGIPDYPVFWEFAYAILNTEEVSVFFFGSSSD